MLEVVGTRVPATNQPARLVTIKLPNDSWTSFCIPIGDDPPVGSAISWGPHHAWWGDDIRVRKLTWEIDPDAPIQ